MIIYKYIDGHQSLGVYSLIYVIVFTAFGLFNIFDNNNYYYYYHWMQSCTSISVAI